MQHTQYRGHITLGQVLDIAEVIQCCCQRSVYAALLMVDEAVIVCFKFGQVMNEVVKMGEMANSVGVGCDEPSRVGQCTEVY